MQYQASKQVDLARAEAITEKAFRAWQDVICPGTTLHPSIQLDDAFGPVGCNESEYNQGDGNANIIMFRDTSWPYDGASHVLALTTVSFGVTSGQIVDVDIEVNSTVHLGVNEDPEGAYDLQSILTHETGHFLGLAHSADQSATMWKEYPQGTIAFRDLSADDVAAICAVYPPLSAGEGAAPVCDFTPNQGFSAECGISPTHGGSCSLGMMGRASCGAPAKLLCGGLAVTLVLSQARRRNARLRSAKVGRS